MEADPSSTIAISVAVATHNRPDRLDRLLRSLCEQTVPPTCFEVVVVDDGSDPSTAACIARAQASSGFRLLALRHERPRGPAAARDAAWRKARAGLVAFTDDDCRVAPGWLAAALAGHQRQPNALIQGMTLPDPEESHRLGPFSRTIEVRALDAGFQTCNIVYPRPLLERIGGFDVEAFDTNPGGEDADLAWRAIKSGSIAVFDRELIAYHAVNDLGPIGKLRVAARWTTPMRAYVRHRELREAHFVKRFFWKGSHYLLIRAALGILLPRRLRWLRPWFIVPYIQTLEVRRRVDRAGVLIHPFYVLHDLVECWAVARAAIRFRHPML